MEASSLAVWHASLALAAQLPRVAHRVAPPPVAPPAVGGCEAGEVAASTVSATCFEHATEHTLAWPRARAFDELKQAVCAAFGHADVSLSDPETRHAIASDSQLKLLMEEWREAEATRVARGWYATTIKTQYIISPQS